MNKTPRIIAVGLNPAWQKTLVFPRFRPYEVNRASAVSETASGKGINFVRAANIWGKAEAQVLQFAGGSNGERLCAVLDSEGIRHDSVQVTGNTRCCNTVLDSAAHTMTELIEPSAAVPPDKVEELFQHFSQDLKQADAVAICGTYPPGVPDDFYARLAAEAKQQGRFVFFDSYKGVEKVLAAGIDLLKINRDELFALSGKDNLKNAYDTCFRKFRIGTIAITDGKEPASFSQGGRTICMCPVPVIEQVVNPIGSGDTCSGVMLSEILSGSSVETAFKAGLAAASANCLTDKPASYDRNIALSLFN